MKLSPTLKQRFEAGLKRSGECLVWAKARNNSGYGMISVASGVSKAAHIVAWYLHYGVWPELHLLHSCDNPACANIDHLSEGTQSQNKLDCAARGRIARGSTHGMSDLTEDAVREMRRLRSDGVMLKELSARYGVCQSTVSQICARKIWRHVEGGDVCTAK